MNSGKKAQCILVKSDEFENPYSLLYILLKSCLCCCSLATLAPQQIFSDIFVIVIIIGHLTVEANLAVIF